MSSNTIDTICCPACGARQAPLPVCRRCKCDLSLLTATIARRRALHAEALQLLREDRADEAVLAAQQRCRIDPDEEAVRLLAVCYLAQHRFQAALEVFTSFRHR